MGNSNPEIKTNKYIKFVVQLNKVCHLPGENIEGALYLEGNPGLKETQLMNPKALFIITEKHKYKYKKNTGDGYVTKNEEINRIIYQKYHLFNNFVGANLLTKVKIPFSIKLPLNSYPSLSFNDGGYVKHNFSVEFELLKIKRTLNIVVKNNPNFTTKNKLLRNPCKYFEKKSKSKFLANKGNFSIYINFPKNVFYYDEPIPYEIKIDCKELKLIINHIEIILIRQRRKNYSSNLKEIRKVEKEELIAYSIKLNKNNKEHIIQNTMNFPHTLKSDKYVYPPTVYKAIEKKGPYRENITDFQNLFYLYPSCRGGLLSIDYFIKVKLFFETSLTFDESFYIPIDFCSRPEEKKMDNNIGKISVYNSDVNLTNTGNAITDGLLNQYDKPHENISNENLNDNLININNKINEDVNNNINNINNNIKQENVNVDINLSDSGYVAPPPIFDNNDNNMKTI